MPLSILLLLYKLETSTLKRDEIKKLEVCEMWLLKESAKVETTDKISNEEILRRVDEQ